VNSVENYDQRTSWRLPEKPGCSSQDNTKVGMEVNCGNMNLIEICHDGMQL
jgi:hypothetical protein